MNALKAVFIMGPGLEVSEGIENIYDREDYLIHSDIKNRAR